MTAITLDQADRLIDAILKRGAELDCRPLSVIVVEPGCKVKAFKKEDGSSMIRFEMAYGKAYAALAMGRSSKLVKVRMTSKSQASLLISGIASAQRSSRALIALVSKMIFEGKLYLS